MKRNEIFEKIKKDNVKFIQLQFTDLFGIVKSLTIPVSLFESSLELGTWFDGSSIEGFARIAESDMYLKPDISTYAVIPWLQSKDGNTTRFICDVYNPDGSPFEGDPRFILKKVLSEAENMGYKFFTGTELEFFLFNKENGIAPLPHDRAGYFDMITDQAYEIRREMTVCMNKFGIEEEATHHEVGQGQHEIDFKYDFALYTADAATTIRSVLKAIAQKNNLHATFMPKPIAGINGNGMHVHQSLFDIKNKNNLFYEKEDKYSLSKTAYNFIAGQLKHIKGMSAIVNPIVNSYKRLVSGYEAPVYISWARVNRSALIRIPKYSKGRINSTRIELRNPDPSCNLYLAFAVMLKAGLDGIKKNLEPPEAIEEDVFNFSDTKLNEMNIDTLPGSLYEALQELKKDTVIKDALGNHTSKKYMEVKKNEWDQFRVQVTKWELDRYLERY